MNSRGWRSLLGAMVALASSSAAADGFSDRAFASGYFRLMARPDFQGGYGRLGYSTLYGRLLNEGPYALLELGLDALKPASPDDVWATVRARIEGGSIAGADGFGGSLAQFRLSQLYVEAGNILSRELTFRLGTLTSTSGDLGLYDLRPAQLLDDTMGLSMNWRSGAFDLLVGVGDSGYFLKPKNYTAVFTGGANLRVRLGDHVEIGAGGQLSWEPFIEGSRSSSYSTPGVRYEDFLRHEVVSHFFEQNPGPTTLFPNAVQSGSANLSYRAVGYVGVGKLGPLKWNSLFVSWQRRHPDVSYVETYGGKDYTIYTGDLTRDRSRLLLGDELQLYLWPDHLDAAIGVLFGDESNPANTVAPGDDNRQYVSTVVRLQAYLTDTMHWLLEGSFAHERSKNGNLYRTHYDSIFANTGGVADTRGFEMGDSPIRNTVQAKTGLVLNPSGVGIFARPSIRLLYGLQYSTQNAAWQNGFVDDLSQFNQFQSVERHWHHVVSLEAEAWF